MVDTIKLKKLAKLARIEIKDENKIINLLNKDIENVKNIGLINTDNLEALNNPYEIELITQEDSINDGNKQDELMKCAPNSMYNYYLVPKVVE